MISSCWIKIDPFLRNLRGDPRYMALVKRMNLPAGLTTTRPPLQREIKGCKAFRDLPDSLARPWQRR